MSEQKKSDNLLSTLAAIARIGLMLIGIAGIAVEIFRDNGWLKQLLRKIFDSSMGIVYVLLGIAAIYILNRWMATADGKASSGKGDLPLYIMMAIGAFFLYNLITTGSF
ncbi:MAG TPA: hypothetical protein VJB68_05190 [Methylophilaceae bacterium]|nr:hypothetical protein [Methylophilaceae bacterium]